MDYIYIDESGELSKRSKYFVIASINWENKGARLKYTIEQMSLRPTNVLFIDDNTFNLQEAKHYLPDLQVAMPDIVPDIIEYVKKLAKKDINQKRLKQYKLLEEKAIAATEYDTNEAFLYASNIRVQINKNCIPVADRIHELILRTNQLNYTKNRISFEELHAMLNDNQYDCGYVMVNDKYGDYGIVGFYANRGGRLEHFLFSCRTMGQMIEQYVYAKIGFPKLEVVGEVRTQLNTHDCPGWINQEKAASCEAQDTEVLACKILLKGPCDLSNSKSFIRTKEEIVTEFTYVKEDNGQVIDTYNHSLHIRGLKEFTDDTKKEIIEDCGFVDEAMFQGTFFTGNYDVIFLSSLIESVYPIYKKKGTSTKVVYRESVNKDRDKKFFEDYEFIGYTTPEEYRQFLVDCLNWLPDKTILCIILGVTSSFDRFTHTATRHLEINTVVKDLAKDNRRLRYIDVDEYVKSVKDITDGINHYQTRVYYEIAQAMIRTINDVTVGKILPINIINVYLINLLKNIRPFVKKFVSHDSNLYHWLQSKYFKVTKRKSNRKK